MATVVDRNKKWYAVINVLDEHGQRKQKWICTDLPSKNGKANKTAAKKIANELQEEYDRKKTPYTSITVAAYFTEWLNQAATEVRPKTYSSYRGNMENHIIPYFKEKRTLLQDLKTVDLEDYYRFKMQPDSRLDASGALSATTIKHHHQNISKALNDAVRRGLILANPATVARTPKAARFKSEYLNPSQVCEVLSLFAGNTAELPITLCALYGLRRSEAIGLQWKNVDFQRRLITVAATMQQGGGECYLSEPKTESSYRTLPMMDSIYMILSAQKDRQNRNRAILGSGYIESDFVCTWDDGRLIAPDYVTREFHKVMKKSKLPTIRLHDLRHCVASNLLNNGYSPTDVAAWLGHSSPNTTFGYYAHASKASKEHISNAVQGWFGTNPLDNP